eukprot:jgi/Tetstr1/430836/TSEL_020617.t1
MSDHRRSEHGAAAARFFWSSPPGKLLGSVLAARAAAASSWGRPDWELHAGAALGGLSSAEETRSVLGALLLSECVYKRPDADALLHLNAFQAELGAPLAPLRRVQFCLDTAPHRYVLAVGGHTLWVCFEGTKHAKDLLTDANFRQSYLWDAAAGPAAAAAHTGFLQRAQAIPVEQLYLHAAARGCRLVLCGHSLGGAIAKLCTLRLRQALGDAAARGPPISCITFACPAVGNRELAAMVERQGWDTSFRNYVLPEDIIPRALGLSMLAPAGLPVPPRPEAIPGAEVAALPQRTADRLRRAALRRLAAISLQPPAPAPAPLEPKAPPSGEAGARPADAAPALVPTKGPPEKAVDGWARALLAAAQSAAGTMLERVPNYALFGQQFYLLPHAAVSLRSLQPSGPAAGIQPADGAWAAQVAAAQGRGAAEVRNGFAHHRMLSYRRRVMSILRSVPGMPLPPLLAPGGGPPPEPEPDERPPPIALCRDIAPRMLPMAAAAMAPLDLLRPSAPPLGAPGPESARAGSQVGEGWRPWAARTGPAQPGTPSTAPQAAPPADTATGSQGEGESAAEDPDSAPGGDTAPPAARSGEAAERTAPGSRKAAAPDGRASAERAAEEVVALVWGLELGSAARASYSGGGARLRCRIHRPPPLPRAPPPPRSRPPGAWWGRWGARADGPQQRQQQQPQRGEEGPGADRAPDRRQLLLSFERPGGAAAAEAAVGAALSLDSDFQHTEVELAYAPWKVLLLSSPACRGAAAFGAALDASATEGPPPPPAAASVPSARSLPPPLLRRPGLQLLSLLAPPAAQHAQLLRWRARTLAFAAAAGLPGGRLAALRLYGWRQLWADLLGALAAAAWRPAGAMGALGDALLRSGWLPGRRALAAADHRLPDGHGTQPDLQVPGYDVAGAHALVALHDVMQLATGALRGDEALVRDAVTAAQAAGLPLIVVLLGWEDLNVHSKAGAVGLLRNCYPAAAIRSDHVVGIGRWRAAGAGPEVEVHGADLRPLWAKLQRELGNARVRGNERLKAAHGGGHQVLPHARGVPATHPT